ncbi:uncharacterized protein LAESUDRAFT_644583, partial [Laetiporus sulphureus 93-53]
LDEVLAFIYIGSCKPIGKEFARTPFLVRRNKVTKALEWLKLNHEDYMNLNISYENLNAYSENVPPVIIDYHDGYMNKAPEATAVNNVNLDKGIVKGSCPFTVHRLTGDAYVNLLADDYQSIRAKAIHQFKKSKILGVGQEQNPQSLYHNSQLYPQMFPWLFLYGLRGLNNDCGSKWVSESKRKQQLLMYHDKCFQLEPYFPLITYNYEQIKNATITGFLLIKKQNFHEIANKIVNLPLSTLESLIT